MGPPAGAAAAGAAGAPKPGATTTGAPKPKLLVPPPPPPMRSSNERLGLGALAAGFAPPTGMNQGVSHMHTAMFLSNIHDTSTAVILL